MPEYGFFLTLIFLFKDRIFDFVLIQKNTGQGKSVLWHILHSPFPSTIMFLYLWKYQKTRYFVILLEDIERNQRHENVFPVRPELFFVPYLWNSCLKTKGYWALTFNVLSKRAKQIRKNTRCGIHYFFQNLKTRISMRLNKHRANGHSNKKNMKDCIQDKIQ